MDVRSLKILILWFVFLSFPLLSTMACSSVEVLPTPQPAATTPPPGIHDGDDNDYLFPGSDQFLALANQAEFVVEGVVGRLWSRFEEDAQGNQLIFSYITVNVIEQWRGQPLPAVITVKNAGGTVGERKMVLTHIPQFWKEGEHVILLLNEREGFLWVRLGEPGKIILTNNQAKFMDQTLSRDQLRALFVKEGGS